jgi:hypothetical protein
MKQLLFLFSLSLLLISCNPEAAKTKTRGGEILNGDHKGGDYEFGTMKAADLAISFSNAFVNKDYSFLSEENFSNKMFFYPEKGLDRLEFGVSEAIDILKGMHQPYDSIRRNIYDVVPVVPSWDPSLTIVMFPFTERRYKDGEEIETYRFFERHYIRDGKITGVRKYSQEK